MIDLQFEDDIGRVSRGEVKVILPRTQYRYFRVIHAAAGQMVSSADIMREVYDGQARSPKIVQVFVFKLRRKIAPLGLEIVACKGVGYGLAEPLK